MISPYLHWCVLNGKEGLVWMVAQRKREQICTINFGERLHPRLRTRRCESADFTGHNFCSHSLRWRFFFNRNFFSKTVRWREKGPVVVGKVVGSFLIMRFWKNREIDGELHDSRGCKTGSSPSNKDVYRLRLLQMQTLDYETRTQQIGCRMPALP